MFNICNIVAYQAVWLACVAGAAHGRPWLGALAASVVVAVHLALVDARKLDLKLIALAAVIGFMVDSALAAAGLIEFTSGVWVQGWTTYWMLALWVTFATTLMHSLHWLLDRPWLAVLTGALGGPVAYYAGARLGALRLHSLDLALLAVGGLWAGALWALSAAARRFSLNVAASTAAPDAERSA